MNINMHKYLMAAASVLIVQVQVLGLLLWVQDYEYFTFRIELMSSSMSNNYYIQEGGACRWLSVNGGDLVSTLFSNYILSNQWAKR